MPDAMGVRRHPAVMAFEAVAVGDDLAGRGHLVLPQDVLDRKLHVGTA
jgi:hypothetical protein